MRDKSKSKGVSGKTKPVVDASAKPSPEEPVLASGAVAKAAAAIANARGNRRGVPTIANILEMLPEKLRIEVIEDAQAALEAVLFNPSSETLTVVLASHVSDGRPHVYCSTYCIHGNHAECRLTCKTCRSPCICACHGEVKSGPDTPAFPPPNTEEPPL